MLIMGMGCYGEREESDFVIGSIGQSRSLVGCMGGDDDVDAYRHVQDCCEHEP
jgi:hypothetical protein